MADKMKHFNVPVVRQVALDKVPLRNGPISQKFCEESIFLISIVNNDQKCPNGMIVCSAGRFWNFRQGLSKSHQFHMINVLENQFTYDKHT